MRLPTRRELAAATVILVVLTLAVTFVSLAVGSPTGARVADVTWFLAQLAGGFLVGATLAESPPQREAESNGTCGVDPSHEVVTIDHRTLEVRCNACREVVYKGLPQAVTLAGLDPCAART